MIVLKRDRSDIRRGLELAFSSVGLDTADSVSREMIDTTTTALETDYIDIYAIESNTRIDTAQNDYLDHYGLMLDEPRESQGFAIVDDLKTIRVSMQDLTGSFRAGRLFTKSGQGFDIESGTPLVDANGKIVMYTSQTATLSEPEVYVKAIAVNTTISAIPSGTIAGVQYDLLSSVDIDRSLVGNFRLTATNETTITKEIVAADEETYRFILQAKARSVNLANDEKINTVFDNLRVRKFKIKRLNPASTSLVLYVETTNNEIESLILQHVQRQLENILPKGMDIRVRPFVYSTLVANLNIAFTRETELPVTNIVKLRSAFKSQFITSVNTQKGGAVVDLQRIINNIKAVDPNIEIVEFDTVRINGRDLERPVYRPKEIEKVFAYENTITFPI